jgi:hypothetical protein
MDISLNEDFPIMNAIGSSVEEDVFDIESESCAPPVLAEASKPLDDGLQGNVDDIFASGEVSDQAFRVDFSEGLPNEVNIYHKYQNVNMSQGWDINAESVGLGSALTHLNAQFNASQGTSRNNVNNDDNNNNNDNGNRSNSMLDAYANSELVISTDELGQSNIDVSVGNPNISQQQQQNTQYQQKRPIASLNINNLEAEPMSFLDDDDFLGVPDPFEFFSYPF